jgi:hypothetical protein
MVSHLYDMTNLIQFDFNQFHGLSVETLSHLKELIYNKRDLISQNGLFDIGKIKKMTKDQIMDEEFEAFFGPQNIKKGVISEKEFQELIDRNESKLFE